MYRIIHLQAISNVLLDAFNDTAKVTKSHIPIVNTPAKIVIPEKHEKMDQTKPHLKCGRSMGSKDTAH